MIYKTLTVMALLVFSFAFTTSEIAPTNISKEEKSATKTSTSELSIEDEIENLYTVFVENNDDVPNIASFKNGMMGYYKLQEENSFEKEILTIIDFSLSSTKKRMWVLDMENNKVLFHSLVSHGQNTGNEFATKFSNTVNSLQSSLGFYVTGETYYGKNGLSMFLDGMEEEFNSRARERYVVVHGADYANPDSIEKFGRLGRSFGCPALPRALTQEIIDTIKDQSVLYIHSSDKDYAANSTMIKA